MKKVSILTVFVFSILLVVSCSDQFNLTPDTEISESPELFKNEGGLRTFTNKFYSHLELGRILSDNDSDNAGTHSTPPSIRSGIYSIPTSLGSGGWGWSELRDINYFIQNVNQHTEDKSLKDKYLGFARFFRALFYFEKVKMFGDVPWYSEPLQKSDSTALYKPRDSRVQVMDSVIADLDFAVENLEERKSKTVITKWTALAYKSRIALFAGTYREYHKEDNLPRADELLEEAIDAAKQLIDANIYSLYSTGDVKTQYAEMFQLHDAPTEEVILARASTQNFLYYTPTFTGSSHGNPGATFSLVSDYANLDGGSYYESHNGNITDIPYYNEFKSRDNRLRQTIVYPGYVRVGTEDTTVNDFTQNILGYQITKRVGEPIEDQGADDRDVILFRYAEVLLNYAEARAILGQLTQKDLDLTLNLLRERAGIKNRLTIPLETDQNQLSRYTRTSDPNVLEVSRERRVELAFEGFRTDDLKRWNEGQLFRDINKGIYIKGYDQFIDLDQDGNNDLYVLEPEEKVPSDTKSGVQYLEFSTQNELTHGDHGRIIPNNKVRREFEDWEYLKPIPAEEITLNPKLEQNPGWDEVK